MNIQVIVTNDKKYYTTIIPNVSGWEAVIKHARTFAHAVSRKYGPVTIDTIKHIK